MADESTPLEADETDTSVQAEDTSAMEPEAGAEPAAPGEKADEAEEHGETLIFGKYKTMDDAEKGYKEAEKAVTRSAELEKQLKAFQEKESRSLEERQEAARARGFNDAEEQQLDFNVKNFEFNRYVEALGATLDGERYQQATAALAQYQQSLNPKDLARAKAFFDPETVAAVASETTLFKQKAYGEYSTAKQQRQFREVQERLGSFAKETGDWLTPKERQDIVGMAVNLTGGSVDLNKVKELVDALEAQAVKAYQEKIKSEAENSALQNSLQPPAGNGSAKADSWITREQYMAMSPDEEAANYERLARQIDLEKQGKIPRMLT